MNHNTRLDRNLARIAFVLCVFLVLYLVWQGCVRSPACTTTPSDVSIGTPLVITRDETGTTHVFEGPEAPDGVAC